MNKLMKFLIILNGLIIPVILIGALMVVFEPFKKNAKNKNNSSLKTEKTLDIKEYELFQKIVYRDPSQVPNSNNYYLPISLETEKEQGFELISKGSNSRSQLINVIFLDKKFNVLNVLLDKKAFINQIKMEDDDYYFQEEKDLLKNVLYEISFEDTNEDGELNSLDESDLYISELDGSDLTKITNDKKIISFDFFNTFSQVLIKYQDYNANSNLEKFEIYDIDTKEFAPVASLNKSIEKIELQIISNE